MPKQHFDHHRSRVGRRIATALLAGTMLASPLAGMASAKEADAAPALSGQQRKGFAEIIEKARPAVVSVIVEKTKQAMAGDRFLQGPNAPDEAPFEEFFERFGIPRDFKWRFDMPGGPRNPGQRAMGQGSGFLISEDGHVVTSHHVIDGADKIMVRTHDGKKLKAKLVGQDPKTDLAVLKVKSGDFAYVEFGDSDSVRVGDWVVAVGNPFGLNGTTTAGIVSARGREIGSGPYDDFFQIDAPINRGNSGGPTFNGKGEVIGVNTAILSPSGGNVGIGFAIPSNDVKKIVADLIEDGVVERGWLGVMIQPVTEDLAKSLGVEKGEGALIASVSEDSPASSAGLEPGDVVQTVDGKAIKSARDLSRIIADKGPEADVALKIWRGGKRITKHITLARLRDHKVASAKPGKRSHAKLGLMLRNSKEGVVVAGVEPGSAAAEKGLTSGDIIEKVDGRRVKTAKDVRQVVVAATKKDKRHVLMLVKGRNGNRFVAFKVKRG